MSGFKAFILKGNLVEIATGLIMALAFATVVSTFTAWLLGLLPDTSSNIFSTAPESFGAFLNAVISFVIVGAVVYFFVVTPYVAAKERFFPSPEPGTPEDVKLLQEIRDLLAQQNGGGSATITPPTP